MPRLTTPRIITFILFVILLSFFYTNISSLKALYKVKVPLNNVTVNLPQDFALTLAQKYIKTFFRTWSGHLHTARPHIASLIPAVPASTINGQHLPYPRKPSLSYLDIDAESLESLTASHRSLMRKLTKAEPALATASQQLYSGTGIVFVAGGEYFGPVLISLRMLRRTGCTLPVEVFLGMRAEYEPELCATILPALGAKCVVLPLFLSPPLTADINHYQLKSLALIFSRFQKVLYLDSDSIPLLDPTTMFSSPLFTDTGLVLWPDFWKATENPAFYNISGVGAFPKDLPPTASEAGQILVDKRPHLSTLLLAGYYNVFGPGWYYELLSQGALGQGDKETFLAAAVVLGAKWKRVQKGVESVGYIRHGGREKVAGMVQFYPGDTEEVADIRPAFIHANTPKMNAGHLVDEGDLFDGAKRIRLWGAKEEAVKRFGEDIERVVWKELVDIGCTFSNVVAEWTGRERLCVRLKEHWKAVFEKAG